MHEAPLGLDDVMAALAAYESQLANQPDSPERHLFATLRTFLWLHSESFQQLLDSKFSRED